MFGWKLNRRKLLADSELLGRWGEGRSEKFLKSKGLKKLIANFLCKGGEIDLVMADRDGSIVFVEVKTRANEDFAPAEAVVTAGKQRRLCKAARYFLLSYNIEDRPYRFDVVVVILGESGREQIRHYKNAFVP